MTGAAPDAGPTGPHRPREMPSSRIDVLRVGDGSARTLRFVTATASGPRRADRRPRAASLLLALALSNLAAGCGGDDDAQPGCEVTLSGDISETYPCVVFACIVRTEEVYDEIYLEAGMVDGPYGLSFTFHVDHPKAFMSGQPYALDDIEPWSGFGFRATTGTRYVARLTGEGGAPRDPAESATLSLEAIGSETLCEAEIVGTAEVSMVEITPQGTVGTGRVTATATFSR